MVLKKLDRLLKLIEEHIDLDHCEKNDERYQKALFYEPVDRPPLVVKAAFGKILMLPAPWDEFERYAYHESFNEPAKMMQNQLLERVVPGLILKDDNPLAIRNDHGTIQVASLLGGQWHFHADNYPWVSHLDSANAIAELVEKDEGISWNGGVIPQSTKTLEFYHEQLAKYPLCKQAIQVSLPDLEGPINTAHLLWGSDIFVEILANRALTSAFLNKIADTMIKVVAYYRNYAVDRLDPFINTQHGYNIPGRLLNRIDSSIMVSPDTYRDVILAVDARLLKEIGTGSIHFCGNGQHLIKPILEIPDLRGLDFGQPELMDTMGIYKKCSERKVAITNLKPPRDDLISGRAAQDYPTGVAFVYNTTDMEDALEVVAGYKTVIK